MPAERMPRARRNDRVRGHDVRRNAPVILVILSIAPCADQQAAGEIRHFKKRHAVFVVVFVALAAFEQRIGFPGGLLIGARRNVGDDSNQYYWRITPYVMPSHTMIPPRAGHPIGGHVWVPIDDTNCWAWSFNYHPKRDLTEAELNAMKDGKGIHVKYMPGTFIPLANKTNDYLMDRAAQKAGVHFSGIEGIAMQDASL